MSSANRLPHEFGPEFTPPAARPAVREAWDEIAAFSPLTDESPTDDSPLEEPMDTTWRGRDVTEADRTHSPPTTARTPITHPAPDMRGAFPTAAEVDECLGALWQVPTVDVPFLRHSLPQAHALAWQAEAAAFIVALAQVRAGLRTDVPMPTAPAPLEAVWDTARRYPRALMDGASGVPLPGTSLPPRDSAICPPSPASA